MSDGRSIARLSLGDVMGNATSTVSFGFIRAGLRPFLGMIALVVGTAMETNPVQAGVTLTVDAKGGVGHLVSIQARYDALDSSATNYLAGALSASLGGGPGFDAYCVDLYHVIYVGGGGFSFEATPKPIGQLDAFGGNGPGIGFLYQTFASAVTSDIDAAALQVAIWKVDYDNGGPLTSGHFTVADSANLTSTQHLVFAKATADLAAYNGTQTGNATWLEATSHPFDGRYDLNQNLVGVYLPGTTPGVVPISTPEPATFATAILGASAFAGLSLRKRLRRKAA
jgi:hypothetical protein